VVEKVKDEKKTKNLSNKQIRIRIIKLCQQTSTTLSKLLIFAPGVALLSNCRKRGGSILLLINKKLTIYLGRRMTQINKRSGYCDIFNLELLHKRISSLLNFSQEPVSRWLEYTLQLYKLKNRLLVALLQTLSDLDPRPPIYISDISSDITLPWVINQAGHLVSLMTLVTRALGLPRNLVLKHNYE
jgi:hypothetical protein